MTDKELPVIDLSKETQEKLVDLINQKLEPTEEMKKLRSVERLFFRTDTALDPN